MIAFRVPAAPSQQSSGMLLHHRPDKHLQAQLELALEVVAQHTQTGPEIQKRRTISFVDPD